MKILVLGGNRFIGLELLALLLLEQADVTVISLDPPPKQILGRVRFIQLDRHASQELSQALGGECFDVTIDNIAREPRDIESLVAILKHRCGRYVLTSSVDIYPQTFAKQWRPEHALLDPSELAGAPASESYRRGKRGCEKFLKGSGLEFSIIRPAIVTGPRDPGSAKPLSWGRGRNDCARSLHLPARVLDGEPILLPADDRRVFQLAFVKDVARALMTAALHPGALGQAFNVAGDELWSHERLIRSLSKLAGTSTDVVRVADSELIDAGLGGYSPPYRVSLQFSLCSTMELKALGWTPTSADVWLDQLLETVRSTGFRPYYELRGKEVALALRVLGVRNRLFPTLQPLPVERSSLQSVQVVRGETLVHPKHFREFRGRKLSSIGIGTHRGAADFATDEMYSTALTRAVEGGINVIDTAINYRGMRSERVVGRVVNEFVEKGASRESVFVVTKGGFIPGDAEDGRSRSAWIAEELVGRGIVDGEEAVHLHSIRESWIRDSFRRSLENLRLTKVDAYLLHNPERALVRMGGRFWNELVRTFSFLEDQVSSGNLEVYGMALWATIGASASSATILPLGKVVECAKAATGGASHNFGILEMPFNIANQSALRRRNQISYGKYLAPLEFAAENQMFVLASASVARAGSLTEQQNRQLPKLGNISSRTALALQFSRSAPNVGTALVGMRQEKHVVEALKVARHSPL